MAIQAKDSSYLGLFDVGIRCVHFRCCFSPPLKYADVNAFLVLAATRNKGTKGEDPTDPVRAEKIIAAATAGHVPVQLVSSKINLAGSISNCSDRSVDLSDKNPLRALPHDANLIDLLAFFADGTRRGAESHPRRRKLG